MPLPDVASVDVLVEEDPTVHLRFHRRDTFPAAAGKRNSVVGPAVRKAVAAAIRVPFCSVVAKSQEVLRSCEGAKVWLIGVDLS